MAQRPKSSSSRSTRSKKNRKNASTVENSDKFFQDLYKNNKGAFPSNLTERDILQALKTNKATQENLTNVVSRMFEGEIEAEQVWEAVQTKKQKDRKKLYPGGNKYGRGVSSTNVHGSVFNGGRNSNRTSRNKTNTGSNRNIFRGKTSNGRKSFSESKGSGKSSLTDFVSKGDSSPARPAKHEGSPNAFATDSVSQTVAGAKLTQVPSVGTVWGGAGNNRVLLKHKENAQLKKNAVARPSSCEPTIGVRLGGEISSSTTKKSTALRTVKQNGSNAAGKHEKIKKKNRTKTTATKLSSKPVTSGKRIMHDSVGKMKPSQDSTANEDSVSAPVTQMVPAIQASEPSAPTALNGIAHKKTSTVAPKLGKLTLGADDGVDDMMFGDFGDEEDLITGHERSPPVVTVDAIETEALAKASTKNVANIDSLAKMQVQKASQEQHPHQPTSRDSISVESAKKHAATFTSNGNSSTSNSNGQQDRRAKHSRNNSNYDKNGARRSNASRGKGGRNQHIRGVPANTVYHPQLQFPGFPQQMQYMDPAIAMMGYGQQLIAPQMQISQQTNASQNGNKPRKAAGPPPGMPDTQKDSLSNSSAAPQVHQSVSGPGGMIAQPGYGANQSQPTYPPGMGGYGNPAQNYYAYPQYGFAQYGGQPYGAQYSQRGTYSHTPPGMPYQPYAPYDPNTQQQQGSGTPQQANSGQNAAQQNGYPQQQVYQQSQYPAQTSALSQGAIVQQAGLSNGGNGNAGSSTAGVYQSYSATSGPIPRSHSQAWA